MRGIKKLLTPVAFIGAFAVAMLAQSSTAHAASHVVLPSTVRAVRTPSKPPKPTPPIGISASGGTLVYLKPHHRDPVYEFAIKLSRAPGKTGVSVNYVTSGSTLLADSLFDNVSGDAIFHGTSTSFKVYVPVIAPLTTTKGSYIYLQLSNPVDGVITGKTGTATLVAKGHVR